MLYARDKVWDSGNDQVMLTERGTTFGYQDLVVDMRGIPAMQQLDVPVVLDPQNPKTPCGGIPSVN